jgi:hypothetical protein
MIFYDNRIYQKFEGNRIYHIKYFYIIPIVQFFNIVLYNKSNIHYNLYHT